MFISRAKKTTLITTPTFILSKINGKKRLNSISKIRNSRPTMKNLLFVETSYPPFQLKPHSKVDIIDLYMVCIGDL